MDWNEHYRRLENMYLSAPMQHFYRDSTIRIEDGKSTIALPVHEGFHHAGKAVHGSVYFRMLDDAAYFAVSSKILDHFLVTSSFNIELVRPITSGLITATGNVRFVSRKHFIAEATLLNEQGKELAFGSGKFVPSQTALSEELGYSL